MMRNKYQLLEDYLVALPPTIDEITLSFKKIETIMGALLPQSAFTYREWWANQSDTSYRPQARAWTNAGFKVHLVAQNRDSGNVKFCRDRENRIETGFSRYEDVKYADKSDTRHVATQNTNNSLLPIHSETNIINTVFLISCVSKKKPTPSPASDLYISDWFLKTKAYVESTHMAWFILSAEYGLLNPELTIKPYEKTLNNMSMAEVRGWADKVIEQMEKNLPQAEQIVIFAGLRYRKFILDYLKKRYKRVDIPLEGLRIGEQLSWLNKQNIHVSD